MSDTPPRPLTLRQQRFVDEYLIDANATQAALRAGYSPHTAARIGSENLYKPPIAAAIAAAQAARSARAEVTADWIVERLRENALRAMEAVPVLNADGEPIGVYRYEGAVANRALELLGKRLGLFTEAAGGPNVLVIELVRDGRVSARREIEAPAASVSQLRAG